MNTEELIAQLRRQAQQIADEGLNGWGNTMLLAAEELERMVKVQGQD